MKKFSYIFIVFFYQVLTFTPVAQTITINWEGLKNFYYSTEQSKIYPYFSNENYSIDEGIPTLYYAEKTNFNGDVYISNLQWKPIEKSQLGDTPIEFIPSEELFSASVTKSRDQKFISVTIKTLKKTGNTIFQLVSFTIDKKSPQVKNFSSLEPHLNVESILQNGTWYKIKISKTGIYKIDRNFLQSLGININSLDPKTIRIFGNGGKMLPEPTSYFRYDNLKENAIFVHGEDDGIFNSEDYVLFYGQGPDYWIRNSTVKHKKNIYEDYAYYFININQTAGKRIQTSPYQTPNAKVYVDYDDHQFYEEDISNLNQVGKIWVGENLGLKNHKEVLFPVHDLVSGSTITWKYSWVSRNGINGKISVLYNDNPVYSSILRPSKNDLDFAIGSQLQSITSNNNQLKFTLSFDNSANPSAEFYPDYFEVIYKQKLKFNGSQMNFRTFDPIENGMIYGFNFVPTEDFEVWDVSDIVNAKKLERSSNSYNFSYQFSSDNFKNEMVAFKHTAAFTPEIVGKITNQALHSISDVDYIIITVPEFVSQANRIKNLHQTQNQLKVEVVTVNQIYNEFSSGGQDLAGIRDFLRYLYKKDNGKLKYVLLLGSTSYDYKNKTGTGYNLIPTYQSYNSTGLNYSFATDDFITILDDDEANMIGEDANISSTQLDIAVGRMIAKNLTEASLCVDKSVKYDNGNASQGTPFGDWRLNASLIVDIDSDNNFHNKIEETIARNIFEKSLKEYTLRKLYIDSYNADYTTGGARFPQVTDAIKAAFNNGNLVINYFGHGGPLSLSQYRLFSKEDVNSLTNFNKDFSRLPLFITISCDVSVWDNPSLNSLGDLLYLKKNGGSNSMITTNRALSIVYGLNMNPIIMKNIFTKNPDKTKYIALGEALRLSKKEIINGESRKVSLLGDPAQSLVYPKRKINVTKINGMNANNFSGIIRALDFITIEGQVLNENGSIDPSFSGNIQTVLYDKPIEKKTLNNFNFSSLNPPLEYKEQVNAIYKGGSKVKNGNFKIEFYVPKDINYDIGEGKLILYSDNAEIDALYIKNDLKVGEINPNGINDTEGPKIGLYMNNLNFTNGGITDRSPYLLACVTDSTGINSTGLGIGHDITGIFNNNVHGTVILNDFYTGGESAPCLNPSLKDYQKGKVWYRLDNLETGNHTVKFKVWDINNNSSSATLDFLVVENGDQGLIIKKLLNWPNPFTTKTFFHFEHNCPDILEVQVQIFTISGKLVKTINKTVTSQPFNEGYRTDKYGIEWDGLDDYGDKIGKGVYIYRMKIKGTSEICKGSVSQVEKLVILK
ncbi:Peptidase family C25 [Apibacter mensalis]|uniref:Peptidase family C25 n=1 Tax=Apibacter mensalis TaxID=1586267 RepID=A0A0X3ARA9_9FLAO|nr:type IX secretion system sortase PorU [Apibacter mensalis]CVK16428.1 Peptidase family C25 [Apibacter mensalis]